MESHFLGEIDARYIEGPWWRMLAPFGFYSAKYDITICAPIGFVTDFASVPRLPVAYLFAGGTGNRKALPHDVGYRWFEERHMFDVIFYEAGEVQIEMFSDRSWLKDGFRSFRNRAMSTVVVGVGWATMSHLPGCLDYRTKKECKKQQRECIACENYYPNWQNCKLKGYRPDILEMHGG